ncbi:histidine phosphatase family protein [Paenibacillus thalictri]|uniref:Histidine phosphatase family protein n=1 Tax=Paenibacillus thalictri TaxID=2527873 RepID=A0A4V2J4D7_9BACL|nr:histidine phosphatase family protein [Paenibacillus thalictri]TBL79362.1 histidine phosphatase family protein [Paenibacillus thalictri]
MHLYVIRHAQSTKNIGQGGGANCSLSEIGEWQAEQVPSFFKDIPIRSIYCSPLRRVIQTATPLAAEKQLPIILVPEMSEMFLDLWTEYRDYPWANCKQLVSAHPLTRFIDSHDTALPWWPKWPEDKAAVRKRVKSFYDACLAPSLATDDHIVVFGHGQSTADLKQIANPGDTFPVYNAGIVEFDLQADGQCQSAVVHTGHLGPHVSD